MADFEDPQSRIEAILQNMLGADNDLPEPQSRNEALLQQILEQGGSGSGISGENGKSIEYDWDGTSLGVKQEGEDNYEYVDLKGDKGDKGDPGDGTVGFIRTAGKKFFDANGNEYIVKGMNFDNWVWFNPSVPMEWYCNENSYAELADMGINTIRWYLNYALLEDDENPGVYKQTGWNWLDQNIAWAEKYGIKMIINMHVPQSLSETDSWDTTVESIQLWYGANAESNRTRFKAMWEAIANRYKDNPTILGYGLLNEPRVPYINNSIADSKAQWEDLADELIEIIREIDTNHILFIEPTTKIHDTTNDMDIWDGFDYVDGMFTVNDDNYAVEFHFYDPMELTHQKTGTYYPPGGMTYPVTDVIAVISKEWIDETSYTGDNAAPYDFTERGYQTVESDKYLVTEASTINLAYPMLVSSNAGSGSTIYWDNVKIAKYTNDGTFVEYVCEYDFNTEDNFITYPGAWDNKVNWSSSGGVDNSGCLVVTGTDGELKVSQNINYKFFEIEPGYKYSAIATVSIVGSTTATILPHIVFWHTNSVHGIDKEYLREMLTDYINFGNTNNVPLYMGEFGAFVESYPYGGRQWASDMIDLANEYNLSASYHEYKPGLYDDYYYSVVDNENATATEGTDVLDTQLHKIFKDRWKSIELTQNVIDKLTNTEKAEYINNWSVPRLRSMSLGYFCWYTSDPTHDRMTKHITAEGFQELKDLGFNAVRMYLHYNTYEDSYDQTTQVSTFKASGWEWLDLQIARAKAAGLRVVLSLHVPQGGFMSDGNFGPFDGETKDNIEYTPEDCFIRIKNLWVALAERYANEPIVEGFDLLNEPYIKVYDATNLSTSELKAQGLDLYYGLIQDIIDAIRKVNTYAYFVIQRPFAVNSTGYSMLESYRLVDDPKVMYDFHWYYWIKYTEQLKDSSHPLVCNYPNPGVAAMISTTSSNFGGITYGNATVDYSNSDWQDVESELIDWPIDSGKAWPSATWMIKISNLGSNGIAYIDDVYVKEYDASGNFVRNLMLIDDFETHSSSGFASWTANSGTGNSLAISTDNNATSNGSKSLKITIASGDLNFGNTSSWYFIPYGGEGHQYKICCKMKFVDCENTTAVKLGLRSPRVNDAFRWTKEDCLRPLIERYIKWAKNNNVELYCGEFGCISSVVASSFGNGKEYLQDVIDLFDEYGVNYSFHDYHSSTWGFYSDADTSYPTTKVANTLDIFENYVE